MKYTVHSIEVSTTKTGKTVANTELKNESGELYNKKVSIWGDFPNFPTITFGQTIEGDIVVNDKGYATLYPPKPSVGRAGGYGGGMKSMIKEKQENIRESQDIKAHGIKEAGSMSGAINMAVAEYNAFSGDETLRPTMEYLVEKNRKWILNKWDLPFN